MAWWRVPWNIAKITILPYIAEFIWNKFKKRNPDLAILVKEAVDAIKQVSLNTSNEQVEYEAVAKICRHHTYYDRGTVTKAVHRYLNLNK
jgi:hypothetical protein